MSAGRTRGRGLASIGLLAFAFVASGPRVRAQELQVTLLGTGNPGPAMDRFGPCILVEAGPEKLLFDAGRGAVQRLHQIDVSFGDITALFLTHLHSDHVVGLPDLWLTGWIISNRSTPLELWGPAGTADMATHLEAAYRFDIDIRVRDDRAPPTGGHLLAHDISEGVVLDRHGVRVTAFEVDHGPVRPALGYRVDYAGRAVVLSGDTRFSPNLIRFAKGTDLLIHEVAAATDEELERSEEARIVVGHHTTPQKAGEVFRQVRPKLAVYSHIALFSRVSTDDVRRLTRDVYDGPLVIGEDLMRFRVGEQVTVGRVIPRPDPTH